MGEAPQISLLSFWMRNFGGGEPRLYEIFGKWKGLEERADKEIVWPPMVVIMNTRHEKDENGEWTGMGNEELLRLLSSYSKVKPRHSYGPEGHRGMSTLIFEASAVGYAEAERLSKHFEDKCRGRLAWESNKVLFNKVSYYSEGKRQLYGYMARKQDLDNFNKHSQESYSLVTEKLRKTMEENRVVKLRTKKHHEQNKEEMDYQEQFFRDQIQQFFDARNANEENFEKIQQYQREKVNQSEANVSSGKERRAEEIAKFIQLQNKEMEEFDNERDKLMKAHEARMMELKQRHRWEEMTLEKDFNELFSKLMEKYTPSGSKQDDSQTRK
ncbi:hypothetical protein BUALT_Bualt11G0023800 [Buddleja alternifolia]|uniref:XS domain-containing protein n=1 Tax=Buddleja alternifolia TaxID=168488 RepID=A0AAV6X2S3_9LAMI|nr:hypothetical protein BUALT_Bualt11G0023800 [Buddleja alternifolia]